MTGGFQLCKESRRKSTSGRGNSSLKGPEVGVSSVYGKNRLTWLKGSEFWDVRLQVIPKPLFIRDQVNKCWIKHKKMQAKP